MKKLLIIINLLVCMTIFSEDVAVKKALVKVYTSHQLFDYLSPWQYGQSANSTATGFIIDGERIITNAHAVLNSKFLQVRKEGDSKKYKAVVKFTSEEYDLALVEIEDKSFFKGTVPLKLGTLPEIQEKLTVYGYPLGGDKLSTTQGIVSRMEHNTYTLTNRKFLIGQTDAAINSGNSGGPVVSKGKVAGVAFAGLNSADNIGYFIPVNILNNFLEDIKDGKYDGSPLLGVEWSELESPSHRRMLGIEAKTGGILIKKVFKNSPFEGVLQKNDVLMKLDNYPIEYDGTIEFRKNEKTDFSYVNQQKKYGDNLSYEIIRDKKTKTGQVKLEKKDIKYTVVTEVTIETPPSYMVYGGLLFEPLTSNYMAGTIEKLGSVYDREELYKDYKELVVLVRVLPFDVNLGYTDAENEIIVKVNGEKYKDFKDFAQKVKNVKSGFIVFENDNGDEIVLDVKEVEEQREELMQNYNISSDMSDDIK